MFVGILKIIQIAFVPRFLVTVILLWSMESFLTPKQPHTAATPDALGCRYQWWYCVVFYYNSVV